MTGDQAPLFARLEVIDDPCPHAAALNMATDEALLDNLADTPLLRIYRWAHPAVSFGYFDEFERVRRTWIERDFVRRWTGGGVVEHGQDFTYSLLVPRAHPLTALRAQESYQLLHENVARAVAKAGPDLPGLTAEGGAAASRQTTRACFDHAVRHDLLLHGDKVAGAAQRRTRRGWLHQGSVNLPGETAILYQRLRQTLPSELAGEFCSRSMQPGEEAAAVQLVRTKYGTDAWLRRF